VSAELRDDDPDVLAAARPLVHEAVETISARRGLRATVRWGQCVPPVAADAVVLAAIEAAAERSTLPWRALWSGAGHDAQILAHYMPTAMIFVPSIGGVSHAPSERTVPPDLVAGAQLLADSLLALDGRPPSEPRA
jgi:acetylornithine deacetylase/succinyl-diaminopimelate desuccinylase-like protein